MLPTYNPGVTLKILHKKSRHHLPKLNSCVTDYSRERLSHKTVNGIKQNSKENDHYMFFKPQHIFVIVQTPKTFS